MTQKDTPKQPAETGAQPHVKKEITSAPELPAAVARQYGLHHHAKHEVASEKSVTPADSPLLADGETEAAVDDIVAQESDELLAAEDAARAGDAIPRRRGFWQRIGGFFAAWWHNKWARYATLLIVFAAVTVVAVIPKTRYLALNTVGVRSSASVVVVDTVTQLPLKNVAVELAGATVKTNVKGEAVFHHLRLGPTTLHIKRIAFASQTQEVTIGWGSNPLGTYKLRATGIQYVLYATDYLSGKGVANAEAVSDEANALADKDGKIVLTVDDASATKLSITLHAAGYRDETVTLDAERDEMAPKVGLVPLGKEVFISRQSGKYDLYSCDIDGKNKQLVLAGTGTEISNISLVTDPTGTRAALVSTRDNIRDKDGYLLATLTLINLQENTTTVVDRAVQIQLLDWTADRLVYRAATSGASAANSQRYRLISYNFDTNNKVQLATANQFTVSLSAGDYIYYAASSDDPRAVRGLYKVRVDGTNRQKVIDQEIWTGFRTAYDTFSIQTPRDWYLYTISTNTAAPTSAPPALASYIFVRSAQDNRYAWVDRRDGKGNLLIYDADSNKTTTVVAREGIAQPVRWAGKDTLIYRVATSGEIADYAISLQGGEGHKITDLTSSYGFSGGQ